MLENGLANGRHIFIGSLCYGPLKLAVLLLKRIQKEHWPEKTILKPMLSPVLKPQYMPTIKVQV